MKKVGKISSECVSLPDEFYDHLDSDNICFHCGRPRYDLVYEVTRYGFPFRFQRCRCGVVKQTPMPNEAFFEWFFNSDLFYSSKKSLQDKIWGFYDYFKDEPCRMATSRYRYRKLARLLSLKKPVEIMKVGPSTGTFLHVADQHGHHAIGCDISADFVEYARKHYGAHIDHGRFERMGYPTARFDMLLLFNVIENLPNPAEFLIEVHRTVKPNGYFVLNFVNMKNNVLAMLQKDGYFLFRPPICYMYDLKTLSDVLTKFGFEVMQVNRDIRHMHPEKILTLLGWRRPLSIARFLRIHRLPFPIYAYPSLVLIARRLK